MPGPTPSEGESPRTVLEVLDRTARLYGDAPAMRVKRDGSWQTTTWREYREQAHAAARGFLRLGLEPGDGVAILGFNRPEWFLADVGAIAAGGVPAGIYTRTTPEQTRYIAQHAEARVAVVEAGEELSTFLAIRPLLPRLEAIVVMDGDAADDGEEGIYSWAELLALGRGVADSELEPRIAAQRPDDLATLIYTSGTTGTPKAVMISHRNLVWTAAQIASVYHLDHGGGVLSYLPLSHIAEQMVSLHCPMAVGACSWFAESLEKLGENLREVRPDFFFAVPRVWEKMQAAILAAGSGSSGLRRRIVAWARRLGLAGGYAEQEGRPRPLLYPLAERLVFSAVRERLGLDRAYVCATSAAPISRDTLDFFLSLGLPIYEVYGMSECTGPTTFSLPGRYRTGRAGRAIAGTELRTLEDGEILMRGPHVFLGYYKDEAATREALDEEGWLHSGDIGELDGEGFLSVTDRKKELLITSGGKNVAPQAIEGRLKEIPVVAQAVVVGDRRHYLSALLAIEPAAGAAAAERAGSPARSPAELARCPVFRRYLEGEVERVNAKLARYETIKRFAVLPAELTVEGGELTPTMKLKRRVIDQKFRAEIDALYR